MNNANLTGASTPVRLLLAGKAAENRPGQTHIELEFRALNDRQMEEINQWLKLEYINSIRDVHAKSDISDAQKQKEIDAGFITASALHWMTGQGQAMMSTPRGLARIVKSHIANDMSLDELTDVLSYYENVNMVNEAIEDINTSDFKKSKLEKLKKKAAKLSGKKPQPLKQRSKKKPKRKSKRTAGSHKSTTGRSAKSRK